MMRTSINELNLILKISVPAKNFLKEEPKDYNDKSHCLGRNFKENLVKVFIAFHLQI